MDRFRPFLARAVSAAVLVGACCAAEAGPLEPPPGPAAPTMKTLAEVEARTPIHQSDLPLTIASDGAYYLAENLSANQNGVIMITITAYNVSIDLNGFTIDGTGQAAVASDCIRIESGVRTFGLTNGVIRGCGQTGVVSQGAFGLTYTIDRVQANQNGQHGMLFSGNTFGVISRSIAKTNADRGLYVTNGILSDCAAFGNGGIGLQVVYGTINGCISHSNVGLNAVILYGGVAVGTYAP